jgi:pantetheine-phosphate adenylyltransferase
MKKIIYAGSFDPITKGHSWLIDEALLLFDEVVVIIANNVAKKYYFTLEERKSFIEYQYAGKKVSIVVLQDDYVAQYAKENNIEYMLRGLRNSVDFEYETTVYNMNHNIAPEIKTIYMRSPANITEISSSNVKSLVGFPRWKKHISSWVNEKVVSGFSKKLYSDKLKKYYQQTLIVNNETFELIVNAYSEPQRYYHTLEHLVELCEKAEMINVHTDPVLMTAIFFHDIVYDPTKNNNEELSVKLWEKLANGVRPELKNKVSNYIIATKTHQNSEQDTLLDIFLDLDLSILGSDSRRFDRYEEEIRWEYAFVPEEIYAKERARIMSSFVGRNFRNDKLNELFLDNYKKNLQKYQKDS